VVLKRVTRDSLSEEFLIPGRKFVPGRNWGGKSVHEKNLLFLFVYSTLTKIHNEVALYGNVYRTQGQTVLTAVADIIKTLFGS